MSEIYRTITNEEEAREFVKELFVIYNEKLNGANADPKVPIGNLLHEASILNQNIWWILHYAIEPIRKGEVFHFDKNGYLKYKPNV